jgi:hypothetical protein
MRDPELEGYVVAIERHLSRWRGREHVLAPPEFELARQWFVGRVALATVLAAIDEAFATDSPPTSLTFCRRFLDALIQPERKG